MPILGLQNIKDAITDAQNLSTPSVDSFSDESQSIQEAQNRAPGSSLGNAITSIRSSIRNAQDIRTVPISIGEELLNDTVDTFSVAGGIVKASRLIALRNRRLNTPSLETFDKNDREIIRNQQEPFLFKPTREGSDTIRDKILISNIDAGEEPGDSLIDTIILDAWPREVNYTPKSNFVAITSIGRNNPHYNYTGSEDTIEFTIDWYTNDSNRDKVISQCRKIEALTKSNGYKKKPPRVKLIWGEQDRLFRGNLWIVVSAPYKMSNFQRAHKQKDGSINYLGSMPQQAYQTITLKRVTNSNLLWSDIQYVAPKTA